MQTCPSCGTDNPDAARFCMACAMSLAAPGPAREVRKTVTIVFSDVTGSTTLGERLDPESLRRVMTRYFEEMRAALERHGGTVEKFIGDAVMAVFGIPALHEDDALRAVRAAAEMRQALADLNAELERDWGVSLQARIGVNTGEVVTADPAGGQHLVTGDAVNVAARLEQVAAPGEVLLGEGTYRLVRDAVRVEAVEPLALKGKASPVPAFRLVDVNPDAPGVERHFDSPMVGRGRQLETLLQSFRSAVDDGACHLFTVLGTAGVGKSRLVQEFLSRLPPETQVLRGRCLSYGQGITYWPVAEILREAAGMQEGDEPTDRRRKLGSLLESSEEADAVTERLEELIGLEEASSTPEETAWAVRKLFEGLARRRPLVVVFDDIHWAEPTFLDLIEHLADWTRDAPVLLVCPSRPDLLDRRPGWGGGKFNATSILLEPLPDADCLSLIDNLLGHVQLPEGMRRRILDAAEGTPLFVEEMLSMLIDDGTLRRDDGRWVAVRDLSEVRVPPTIQALLAARLDQLHLEERAVVECGAVEGKVFHRSAVAELAPETIRTGLDTYLRALTRRELIRPHAAEAIGDDAFRFRHQLIRDAAYEGMPKGIRAELHDRFAAWLEREAGERAAEFDEIVGYHLEQTYRYRTELGPVGADEERVARRAARLLAGAGRRALARGDAQAAANLLERATRLLPSSDPERLEALVELTRVLDVDLGEFQRAETLLDDTLGEVASSPEVALVMRLRIARALVLASTDPDAFVLDAPALTAEAIPLFEEAGDDRGLAEAWTLIAIRLNQVGHPKSMEEAELRAIEHSRRAGDRHSEMELTTWMAATLFWGETPVDEGISRLQEMLVKMKGHRLHEAKIGRFLAGFLAMQGRFDEARRLVRESAVTFSELGVRMWLASANGFFAAPVEIRAGDLEAAERILRESIATLDDMGERALTCSLAAFLAETLYLQGRYDEADTWTGRAAEIAGAHDQEAQSDIRAIRAKVAARRGDLAGAERLAREAVEIAGGTGELDHIGDSYFDLAEVMRLAGRMDEAAEALREAIRQWQRKGNVVSENKARALLADMGAEPDG